MSKLDQIKNHIDSNTIVAFHYADFEDFCFKNEVIDDRTISKYIRVLIAQEYILKVDGVYEVQHLLEFFEKIQQGEKFQYVFQGRKMEPKDTKLEIIVGD